MDVILWWFLYIFAALQRSTTNEYNYRHKKLQMLKSGASFVIDLWLCRCAMQPLEDSKKTNLVLAFLSFSSL